MGKVYTIPIYGDFEDGLLGLPHYFLVAICVTIACQGLGSDTLRYVCQFSGHFSSLSIGFPSCHLDRFLAQGSTFQEPMNPKLQVRWNPGIHQILSGPRDLNQCCPGVRAFLCFFQLQLTLPADIARTFPLSRAILLHIATSPA